jgi:hypothetical protein
MPKIHPNDVIEQVRSYEREIFFQGDPGEDFDFQDLIENKFFIITADGTLTSLIMNPAQEILWHHVLDDYLSGRPMFYDIMKIRQLGLSTEIDGIITGLCFVNPNRRALITSYDDEHTQRLFQMCTTFYENLPNEYREARQLTTPNPMVSRLKFKSPHNTSLRLATAKNIDAGRGDTLQYYHGSECSRYVNLAKLRTGLDIAVHYLPGNFFAWETTPPEMGTGAEYKTMRRNHIAKYESGDYKFTPIFLSFADVKHEHPHYFLPLAPGEKLVLNEPLQRYYNKHKHILTPEQMKWIAAEVDHMDGNMAEFNKEYPISEEIAFMQQGGAFFSLEHLTEQRRKYEKAPEYLVTLEFAQHVECSSEFSMKDGHKDNGCGWSGFFKEAEKPKACPNCTTHRLTSRSYPGCPVIATKIAREELPGQYFYVEVYKEPNPDSDYLISMDVGEGVGANYSVAHVWEVIRFKSHILLDQAAKYFNNHVNPVDAGIHAFMMGQWYNWALILVERNNPGQATARNLQDGFSQQQATWGGYPYLYYEVRQIEKDKAPTKRIGFNTNKSTKSQILAALQKHIISEDLIIHSGRTYDELMGFYNDPDKKEYVQQHLDPVSRRYHDDEVMSVAMADPCLQSFLEDPRVLPRAKSGAF